MKERKKVADLFLELKFPTNGMNKLIWFFKAQMTRHAT